MAKNAPAGPPPITTALSPLLKGVPAADEDEEPVLDIGVSVRIRHSGGFWVQPRPTRRSTYVFALRPNKRQLFNAPLCDRFPIRLRSNVRCEEPGKETAFLGCERLFRRNGVKGLVGIYARTREVSTGEITAGGHDSRPYRPVRAREASPGSWSTVGIEDNSQPLCRADDAGTSQITGAVSATSECRRIACAPTWAAAHKRVDRRA